MILVERQGARVPALGFGTWQLTGERCREAVADALAVGYRHLDTARVYDNEAAVGRGMRDAGVPREEIFLISKVGFDDLAPERVRRAGEESLRDLGTDYLDLWLVHWPPLDRPVEPTLAVMAKLVEEGAVRHLGVSNFPPSRLGRAAAAAALLCLQVEYHPFLGQERLLAICRRHAMALTAYSPLARGRVGDDPTLREIARRHRKTAAQVTLRWLVQQEGVAAIPKAASREHRRENFAIWDFALSGEEMAAIHALDRGRRYVDPSFAPDWDR
ncbi:MAG TPA: aldo/keto reductase [Thermoanaerobaculia bacterium]|nr:aldo/keto reductase [Thermoanaerobaculia bacterium]